MPATPGERQTRRKGFASHRNAQFFNALRLETTERLGEGQGRVSRAEERRLVVAARGGDPRALRTLLQSVSGPIYRFGRNFCRDTHDAEDVMQEVLTSLVRSLHRFRGESSITTWAYTVARNSCIRRRRKGMGEPEMLLSLDQAGPGGAEGLEIPDPAGDPGRDLEQIELREALRNAIAALPSGQREVLILRDIEGLSAREVAKAIRIQERAVKSRLHRARRALRAALEPHTQARSSQAGTAQSRTCERTISILSRYIEGDVDAPMCERLYAHVDGCPACGAACDSLRAVLGACRKSRSERMPAKMQGAVRSAIRRAVEARSFFR